MKDKNGNPITDDGIMMLLRSDKAEDRGEALELLYGDGNGALLITVGTESATSSITKEVDVGRLFQILLALSQQFGAHVGLQLGWVPTKQDENRILRPSGFGG